MKLKEILITVAFRAVVPADTKTEDICVGLDVSEVNITKGGILPSVGRILGFETIDVAPSLPEEET